MTYKEQLEFQYDVLGHGELPNPHYTEVRHLPSGETNWFVSKGDFSQYINQYEGKLDQLYIGVNPRKTITKGGKAEDVSYLTTLFIDIDPDNPKGTPSTDEQHNKCLRIGAKLSLDLSGSFLADSGSGCHIYLPISPIEVVDYKVLTKQVKEWFDEIKAKYEEPGVRFDSVFDLSRIARVWGTFNSKSKRFCTPIVQQIPTAIERQKFDFYTTRQVDKKVLGTVSNKTQARFNQLLKIHTGIGKIMSGEAQHDSRSESDFSFITYLTKAHFTSEEIKELAKLNPSGRGEDIREDDIDRIIDKCKNNGIGNVSLVHASDKYFKKLDERKMGIESGFKKLDDMLGGFQKGKMYVVAARTNEGKTSLSTQLGYRFASKGMVTLYFPTELGYEPLFDKILSQKLSINLKKFQLGGFSSQESLQIADSKKEFETVPFVVHEDFKLTTDQIERTIREIAPDIVVIDFIQALHYDRGGEPHEIGEAVRKIKELTSTYNVVTILNSQLNRGAINGEINLSQLKGSGAIEEFADVVLALSTLSRLDYPRPVDLHILKSRYSEIGTIRLDFFSSISKFQEHEG